MRMKIKNIISKIALTALIVFAGMSINPLNSFAQEIQYHPENNTITIDGYTYQCVDNTKAVSQKPNINKANMLGMFMEDDVSMDMAASGRPTPNCDEDGKQTFSGYGWKASGDVNLFNDTTHTHTYQEEYYCGDHKTSWIIHYAHWYNGKVVVQEKGKTKCDCGINHHGSHKAVNGCNNTKTTITIPAGGHKDECVHLEKTSGKIMLSDPMFGVDGLVFVYYVKETDLFYGHAMQCQRPNDIKDDEGYYGCGSTYAAASGRTTDKNSAKQEKHSSYAHTLNDGEAALLVKCNVNASAGDIVYVCPKCFICSHNKLDVVPYTVTYVGHNQTGSNKARGAYTVKTPAQIFGSGNVNKPTRNLSSYPINPPTGYHFNATPYWEASFAGWQDGSKVRQGGDSITISANKTLTATWNWTAKSTPVANTYTVTYSGNGATSGSTASSSHTYDVAKALTANGFKREYTITYKYNNGNADGSIKVAYSSAGWSWNNGSYIDKQVVKNLITTNGGTINMSAKWTSKSTTLPTPIKTGYTFDGWYNGSTKVGNAGASYTPTGNITLTAKWTPITYTVKYNGNGSTSGTMADSTFTYDKEGEKLRDFAFGQKFTVTYDANGGENVAAKTIASTIMNPCWNEKADGSGTGHINQETVKNWATTPKTITLYAQWKHNSITLPTAKRTGYEFDGWYKGSTKIGDAGDSYTPNADVTLTAHWTPITYYIQFDPNKGGAVTGMTVKYDQIVNFPTCSRTGYSFKGWILKTNGCNTDPLTNGNPTYYTNNVLCNHTAVKNSTVTFIAVWNHTHTVGSVEFSCPQESSTYIYKNPSAGLSYPLYWLNTNNTNNLSFQIKGSIGGESYNVITAYGVEGSSTLTFEPKKTIPTHTQSSLGSADASVTGNASGDVYGYIEHSCVWNDNQSCCNSYKDKHVKSSNKIQMAGDCDAPAISGIDLFETYIGLDLEEYSVGDLICKFTATDALSGFKPSSTIIIRNEDNHLQKTLTKTTKATALGNVTKFETEDIDVSINAEDEDGEVTSELFNGKVVVWYNLIDNVGNVLTSSEDVSLFNMKMKLKSHTYNPSNYETLSGVEYLSCKQGEAVDMTIRTTGYANAVKIEFPSSWYTGEYPIYIYKGDSGDYDRDLLEPIHADYFYLPTLNDDKGNWERTVTFIIPLYTDKETLNKVSVVGYKGDITVIDNYRIKINNSPSETLTRSQKVWVNEGNILDDNYTAIMDTYRKKRH